MEWSKKETEVGASASSGFKKHSHLKNNTLEIHSQQNQLVAIASKLREAYSLSEKLCFQNGEPALLDKPDPIRNCIYGALRVLADWHQELEDAKRGVA